MLAPNPAMQAPAPALIKRFEKHFIPEPNSGCWLWFGAGSPWYGSFNVDGVIRKAHRVAYELYVGPIPDELQLDHRCRMPCCVNPEHLEPVTGMVNVHRSPLWMGNQTHCKNGHEFTAENTRYYRGNRRCRECNKKWCGMKYQKVRDART